MCFFSFVFGKMCKTESKRCLNIFLYNLHKVDEMKIGLRFIESDKQATLFLFCSFSSSFSVFLFVFCFSILYIMNHVAETSGIVNERNTSYWLLNNFGLIQCTWNIFAKLIHMMLYRKFYLLLCQIFFSLGFLWFRISYVPLFAHLEIRNEQKRTRRKTERNKTKPDWETGNEESKRNK